MPISSRTAPPDEWSPTWRSIATVLLVIHFTCVFVVLSSNNGRSQLQQRLVRVFGVYTQLFNFDPNSAPYVLTRGDLTDDTVFEIELYEKPAPISKKNPLIKTVTLPDHGSRLLDQRRRYLNLGREVAMASDPQAPDDDVTGEIAKAIGSGVMAEAGAKRAVVRCLRRQAQPLDMRNLPPGMKRDDPTDRSYDRVIYEADVWFDEESKTVQAQKKVGRNEVAPQQTGGS